MFSCSRRLVLRSPSGRARSWVAALSCPGRSAARSGALQTRDRSSLWRSRISDAPLHFVTRCTASGTRDSVGRARSLIHFSNSLPRSRGALFAPGVCDFSFTHPEARGGRSAEKRSGACEAPVRPAHDAAGQALARRLASHNAGRSPLGAPPWRFWAPGAALLSPALAPDRLQRAPRTPVVVPGGRGPEPPEASGDGATHHRTPRLAPHSGSSLEHALNERGWEWF